MSDPHASASAPAEDEPKTPMWLPALGAALFVSAGLWWAVTPVAMAPVADQPAASASASAVAMAAPPPSAAAPRPMPTPPPSAQAGTPIPFGAASVVAPLRRPGAAGSAAGAQPRKRPSP